jgi:NAD(P)H dehydrogenase (quinone)
MHIYIVFAHPSKKSFTHAVLRSFIAGLRETAHTYELGDLYEMGFQTDMDLAQYERETSFDSTLPIPPDVAAEQAKLARADGLVLIYPLWWSDCPAKLKGWFDRVWTLGYAYDYEEGGHAAPGIGIEKALVICPAGHPAEHLEETGIAQSMRCIMLNDRLLGVGVKEAMLEILGGMVEQDPAIRERNLQRAYELGRTFGKANPN